MKLHLPTTLRIASSAFIILLLFPTVGLRAQLLGDEGFTPGETIISPMQVQFSVNPGKTETRFVDVGNQSNETHSYRVSYQDFDLTQEGQPELMEPGTSPCSLHKLVRVSPEQLTLDPGETGRIALTLDVPEGAVSSRAAWGMVTIEHVDEGTLTASMGPGASAGLTSSVAYSVWLYQNPREASQTQLDITNFIVGNKNRNKGVFLKVKNKGDGISVCNAYVEITNLKTGEQILIEDRQYTLLPGSRRTFAFDLEESLPKGTYSAVGKLNYPDREELVATELEFKID